VDETDEEEVPLATGRARIREDKSEVVRSEASYTKMHIQNGVSSFPKKDKSMDGNSVRLLENQYMCM
jgi:hypothetical protein